MNRNQHLDVTVSGMDAMNGTSEVAKNRSRSAGKKIDAGETAGLPDGPALGVRMEAGFQ